VRPVPRYTLAVMAAFVAFELWVPLLATALRALAGPTVPTAVQVLASLLGLAVPTVVGLALSDYLADRPGLVKPYQPKRRVGNGTGEEGPASEEAAEGSAREPGESGASDDPRSADRSGPLSDRPRPEGGSYGRTRRDGGGRA
jgi:hypothetical protein